MKTMKKYLAIGLCIIALLPAISQAQTIYKVDNSKTGNVRLAGTSNIHGWEMNARTFTGNADFGFSQDSANRLQSINALTFSLDVLDLQSKDKGLEHSAYKALKVGCYENIEYKLTSATIRPWKVNKYFVKTEGELSIAGVTKAVSMEVYCVVNKDETVTCSGTERIKMTDYGVTPRIFLGIMKAGNTMLLDFSMIYNK